MQLIDQHTKKIMEECKSRARDAGLAFSDETLEYVVTNRDLVELQPKIMIPSLYDYWVDDLMVLQGKGKYELYPHNPYETVINTRPGMSFYNDNNPDWMNVMIFYHVLGHIDFFQNNQLFENTWKDDFAGKALADKRQIAKIRSQHGRWTDYVIEFTRSIDNLVNFYQELSGEHRKKPCKLDAYFDIYLRKAGISDSDFIKEIDEYNSLQSKFGEIGETMFFANVHDRHQDFEQFFEKLWETDEASPIDLIQYLEQNSAFLNRKENQWMKSVMNIVRDTSLYFMPQIRTKFFNEGWASYWHDRLFLQDPRIKGHEIDYVILNTNVTFLPLGDINPYGIGLRLIQYAEDKAEKGQLCNEFDRLTGIEERRNFDRKTGKGLEYIFRMRREMSDFDLINTFTDQDFVNRFGLFVVGKRINEENDTMEYYVKSKKGIDYKRMLLEELYHPPHITIDEDKTKEGVLYLRHNFEGKELVRDYLENTMLGISYLWGGHVSLETTEIDEMAEASQDGANTPLSRVLYTYADKSLSKARID